MQSNQELTLTISSYLTDRSGGRFARVQFERQGKEGIERAEGILPEGRIVRQEGYTAEEVAHLEAYLRENMTELLAQAKALSDPLKWLS
ncbi:MAG: hypothetical protein IJT34_10920 [Butyrivibrio sp.]|nr:hypothetical protein [Butyrivibrio sp.]